MTEHPIPNLYDGWREERWETPVSDAGSLRLVALLDDGSLHLTLEDAHDAERRRWRITFPQTAGYVNLLEEYRVRLWELLRGERLGWTVRVIGSPWVALLRSTEGMIQTVHPQLRHFQVRTEDDVIDVLTSIDPIIVEIEPAPVGSPPAGRSTVMYASRDGAAIESYMTNLVNELRQIGPEKPTSPEPQGPPEPTR
jgi:hypothetical protein